MTTKHVAAAVAPVVHGPHTSASDAPPSSPLLVLTSHVLLTHITSFQRGAPGVMELLVKRYLAEGFLQCSVNDRFACPAYTWPRAFWKSTHRISTVVCDDIRPKSKWLEHVIPEAIAKYDTTDLHTLQIVFRACVSTTFQVERATRKLVHRLCEAAAAFGRVDMLVWLHRHGQIDKNDASLVPLCVKIAARHGQVAVLSWIETNCSSASMEVLHGYTILEIVRRGHVNVIRWMVKRHLGVASRRALCTAIDQGDVSMLRVLLDEFAVAKPFAMYASGDLVKFATRSGHLEVVELLVSEKQQEQFTPRTVEKAIAMGRLDIAKLLLDHRNTGAVAVDATASPASHYLSSWVVKDWIIKNNLAVLAMMAKVKDPQSLGCSVIQCIYVQKYTEQAVALLVTMSSTEEIIRTVLMLAVRERKKKEKTPTLSNILQLLTASTAVALPAAVLSFVERARTDTLGVMVSHLIESSTTAGECATKMKQLIATAREDDVRDTMLWLTWKMSDIYVDILKFDKARRKKEGTTYKYICDQEFLTLCVRLYPKRNALYLEDRIARMQSEKDGQAAAEVAAAAATSVAGEATV